MPKAMTIPTIRTTFPEEWVVAEVIKVDKADVPITGVVLQHSPDKHTVYEAVQAHRAQHPTARLFAFFTGDPIPEGIEVAFAIG